MAINDKTQRKCFTFVWKIENATYCINLEDCIESPAFTVNEIHGTKWKLELYLSLSLDIGFFLQRQGNNQGDEIAAIECELAFLSLDGAVLKLWEKENTDNSSNRLMMGTWEFSNRNEVFFEKRSVFLPQDTLTARCRIWKSFGAMKDVQCFACTRVSVEKRSFLWNIPDFSILETGDKQNCEIKSLGDGEPLIAFDLFLRQIMIGDEIIYLNVFPNFQKVICISFRLSILDASKNTVRCFQEEFEQADCFANKDIALLYTKRELMENKSVYLPNDVLSLWCECAFSYGITLQEIEMANCDSIGIEEKELNNGSVNLDKLPMPKSILIADFKSMFNDSIHSDIKLKTSSQTYFAHKCILSARSPVFKAMFSNDMKEKINDCVDIQDLSDDTVLRMLQYIYTSNVGKLEWGIAANLYEAGDKYQILNLKDICSSYLKRNLCAKNACEALVLADLHQDEDFKAFVHHFILSQGEDVVDSVEWEQLEETHLKLAYETIRLKFKKQVK